VVLKEKRRRRCWERKREGRGRERTEREISEQSKCGTLIGPFRKLNPSSVAA
jgi:hypothetical protein